MSKPQEILELEKVYGITLTETKVAYDIKSQKNSNLYFLSDQKEVVGLNLKGNRIKEIKNLETLTNLSTLDISWNQISKIENLETLTNLSTLYISENQISKIENLETLTNLSTLYISSNQISKIENLETLTNLSTLYIFNNQISKIENLEPLTNLSTLYISYNQISTIENLETLTNLSTLYISGNQISKIENLETLTNLSLLYISFNQISKIENLDTLTNLSELNISSNQISKIENLETLTNLSELNISDNQISKIENLEMLTNLSELYIPSNQISKIDVLKGVLKLLKLQYLEVRQNPFVATENLILKAGENHLDTIKSELQKRVELEKDDAITIQFPVKVMLLGNHASGKSSLVTYFQTQQCSKVDLSQNNSTHVLSVVHSEKEINHKLPKAIFYDFGGQDYYHGVYQAFFTQEAVNLLVWNPKSNCNELLENDSNNYPIRNYNLRYWLEQLHYIFTRKLQKQQLNNDPLLLIQTFADKYPKKKNFKEIDLIPNLIDQFHISLNSDFKSPKNDTALNHITAVFWDTIQERTDEKGVPAWFPEFLSYILNETEKDAIPLETIIQHYKREVTDSFKQKDKEDALRADLEQLSRKGLLLYYKNDTAINDVAWLNPSKTVSNIHDGILNKEIIKEHGKLSKEAFQELGIDYKIERLLINEKILFFDSGYQEYIIPNYLPLALESDRNYLLQKYGFTEPAFTLKFEYFIPFGLINQLICHYGQNPDVKQYWRNQLIFTFNSEFKVWIQLNFSQLTIAVFIQSIAKNNKKLNDAIQELFFGILLLYCGKDISEIQDTGGFNEVFSTAFQKEATKVQQYKEMFNETLKPKGLYISVDEEYFVKYNDLNDSGKTKDDIISYKLPKNENDLNKDDYKLRPSHFYQNFTDNKNIQKMKKIFISYSRKDVEYKDELRKHLNMLNLFDIANNWSCEDVEIGEWNDQIQKKLKESDLVIFMLSVNFFNSLYILYEEVQKTIDEMKVNSNKKIYSILVSDFSGLENYDPSNLSEKQKAILKLREFQYGTYHKEENKLTGNKEEKLVTLKKASRLGILDEQLTKITDKILKDI